VVLSCSGWSCTRLISISEVPGGNPVARNDPEHFCVAFLVCPDCHAAFCDRCVPRSPFHTARCKHCSGELVDGAHRDRIVAGGKAECVRHNEAGFALGGAGRFDDALAEFDEAIRLREEYIAAHFNRGMALNLLGRSGEAIAAFEQVTQVDPTNVQAMYDIGGVYRTVGDLERALDAYHRALAAQPRYVAARVNLAVTLNDLDRCAEAVRACDRAIQIDMAEVAADQFPNARSFAYGAKGAALLKLGRNEEALEAIDLALADREDAQNHANRAAVLERLGRHEEARAAALRAQQLRQ
jgi:tetratricopeptide (TPR) repeat protein